MADLEVENTLREIRERVLAGAALRAPATNGAHATTADAEAPSANGHAGGASEALARMDAGLATSARAWSRLPPLLSYRQGASARLELWVKRLVKRAAHWFTWEQVNFNSAVHHALGDARTALSAHEHRLAAHEQVMTGQGQAIAVQGQALSAHEQRLAAGERNLTALGQTLALLRSDLLAAVRAEGEAGRERAAELLSRLSDAEARFEAAAAQLRREIAEGLERLAESQRASAESLREELREELRAEHRAEVRARAEELHAEFRGRVDGLLQEQRVCFKQLSLEAGEAAVMQDRARRQLEARLEALEQNRERAL